MISLRARGQCYSAVVPLVGGSEHFPDICRIHHRSVLYSQRGEYSIGSGRGFSVDDDL